MGFRVQGFRDMGCRGGSVWGVRASPWCFIGKQPMLCRDHCTYSYGDACHHRILGTR